MPWVLTLFIILGALVSACNGTDNTISGAIINTTENASSGDSVANSNPEPQEIDPVVDPTSTDLPQPTPTFDFNGSWMHVSSPGDLDCGSFQKVVDPISGVIEVVMSEDSSSMTLLGMTDYPELELEKVEDNLYRVEMTRTVDGVTGTITVEVTVVSAEMMLGEVRTVFGPCFFQRSFQLDKAA